MKYYDLQVTDIANTIDANIRTIQDNDLSRDLASVNVLSISRSFVEHIIFQVYCHACDPDFIGPENEYDTIYNKAIPWVKQFAKYRFLIQWHEYLQKTNSHYVPTGDNGSRLLLHYFDYLIRARDFEKNTFHLEILSSISIYPLDLDDIQLDFYKSIGTTILSHTHDAFAADSMPYYVIRKRLIYVPGLTFYELTLLPANDHADKFNRVTVYSLEDVMTQFAIRASFLETDVKVFDRNVKIQLLSNWEISIRPCELIQLARIVGENLSIDRSHASYKNLCSFLQAEQLGLNDILTLDRASFDSAMEKAKLIGTRLFEVLAKASSIIDDCQLGWKTLLYLSAEMRHAVMKSQYPIGFSAKKLENTDVVLKKGCYTFETAPFSASLVDHNPSLYVLTCCFDQNKHEDEMLAREIRERSLLEQDIFVSKNDLVGFSNIPGLIRKYNSKVISEMSIGEYKDYLYIQGVFSSTKSIIDNLLSRMGNGISGYSSTAKSWIEKLPADRKNDPDKVRALTELFEHNNIAFIYGPAGTGKSTFISMVCEMLDDVSILIATHTKSSLDHLRRLCKGTKMRFATLSQLKRRDSIECSLFIVDECSAADNMAIAAVLPKLNCSVLLFAGDTEQLEPIRFGNWFLFAKHYFEKTSVFELTNKYRTNNPGLLSLWDAVRKAESEQAVGTIIERHRYSKPMDASILETPKDDEIILCLNYDGLFGINNINGYLQSSNPNPPIRWGRRIYKVGDPILFIDNYRFHELLYNNLKGRLLDIKCMTDRIVFQIRVERVINQLSIPSSSGLRLIDTSPNSSVVEFDVFTWSESHDDDEKAFLSIVPFQVAYSASIHKAQGLEYNSVKIVISKSVEERIDLHVFYTAITRAKNHLSIYWSPESEKKVLSSLSKKNHARDLKLFSGIG